MRSHIVEFAVSRRSSRLAAGGCIASALFVMLAAAEIRGAEDAAPQFLDLSLTVAPNMPCTWPAGFPPFQINPYLRIGPLTAFNSEILTIDETTGTQSDAPTHPVAPPDSKKPNAGPFGLMSSDKVPAWQFAGEACVIDCRDLLDRAPNGRSSLVQKPRIVAWEKSPRPLAFGDVVLFHGGHSDRYYQPFPAGRRFLADALEKKVPGWPDPDPDCMEYLATRKVMTLRRSE